MGIEVKSDGNEIINEDEASPHATISTLDNEGNIDVQNVEVGEVGDPVFDPLAAVGHALNGEPLEFENQIKLGLADRLQNAVERKRDEVAQAIFGTQDQETEVDDNTPETDEEGEVLTDQDENEDQSEE